MKKKLVRLFSPPPIASVLSILAAALLLVYVFTAEVDGMLRYAAYALSAYALLVLVFGAKRLFRYLQNTSWMRRLLQKPHVDAWLNDPIYRTRLSLYFSTAVNAAYIGIKLVTGFVLRSEWLIAFALYYIVLTALRGSLVNYLRHHPVRHDLASEYRRYRWIGILLLSTTVVLSIIITRMIGYNETHDYPGVLIYAMAAYVFYAVILASINLVRFRKHGSPVISAIKAVSLTTALVALLGLEAAMLSRVGGEDTSPFRATMLAVTGLVICLIIVCMSVNMIVNANQHLRLLKEEPSHE